MKSLDFGRYALCSYVAAALLAGCAGTHVPAFTPGSNAAPPFPDALEAGATEKVLYSFAGGNDGAVPQAALISRSGEFYGTTVRGGKGGCPDVHGCGTIYKVSLSGKERVLHVFHSGNDGEAPNASLIDVDGSLFGTTVFGGGSVCKAGHATGCGTAFELTPEGKELVLYRFRGGALGALPVSNLTLFKHAFYGEAAAGGTGKCYYADYSGCGTIFKMSPSGHASIVYMFKGGRDAGTPQGGIVSFKGSFYGTTSAGGHTCAFSYGCGTVFKVTPSGGETILHAFKGNRNDGAVPSSGLVVLNGALYGTTYSGGKYDCALSGSGYGCGTVFKVTLSGRERIIHNFNGATDGAFPNQLVAIGGKLYGTTQSGGKGSSCGTGCGIVFDLTPSGQETILYRFKGAEDGSNPSAGLIEAGRMLYGTTTAGGTDGDGTVYAVTP